MATLIFIWRERRGLNLEGKEDVRYGETEAVRKECIEYNLKGAEGM